MIPNKAFQALACGTPLVTADTPAARELLRDGESALLVPPGDAGALAAALARLAAEPALAASLSAGGLAAYRAQASEARARRALARPDREPAVRARPLLWAAIAAYAAGFGSLSILRHRAFDTGRYDLGNMVQTVWNTAHGHFLQMTGGDGRQISRLAAHFDPILAAFAPLWWIWPSPEMLLDRHRRSRSRSARCPSSGSPASTSAPSGPGSASRSPTCSTRRPSG